MFIVETRGRTLEETAALFDGEDKPDTLAQMSRESAVISIRRRSVLGDEQDDDFIYSGYSGKVHPLDSYELRRPQLVLERDRWGHTKGRGGIFH
jgi:hypothetical protein